MSKKILSILALICLTFTCAWADENEDFNTVDGALSYIGDHVKITVDNSGDKYGFEISPSESATIEVLYDATIVGVEIFIGSGYPYDLCSNIGDISVNTTLYMASINNLNVSSLTISATHKLNVKRVMVYYKLGHIIAAGHCGTGTSSYHKKEVAWSFSDAGVLTIKGTNAMIDLDENTKDNVPWKGYRNDIKSVVIDNGVTSIGGYNFYNCPNLKSVSISSSVTSISQYAFAGCSGLESITIPGSVSTISPYTFNECSVLATVSLGDGVKTIGSNAFRKCNYLVSFTFPASVTNIQSQAFNQCNNLVSITLNSNPFIGENAFSTSPNVRMYLPAHEGKTGKYWLTFYNPYYNFELPPTDVQIFKAALDGTIMTLTELTTDKIVKKGNPVILKSNSATVPLQITPNSPRNDFTGNDLQGVSSEAGLTASDQCYTFVLNKGFLGVGFYMLQSGKTLGFGKAFLTYSASQAPEFLYFDEDSATSIDNSSQSSSAGGTQFTIDNDAGVIYNLAGQRIQKMQRGINIVNGKKIINK